MGYCVTTPEREKVRQKKLTCTQKTASREIFSYCVKTSQENRSQAPELHQGNRLTSTKIASGIPYWPSRDPIKERGGINVYGFVINNPIWHWDRLGRQGITGSGATSQSLNDHIDQNIDNAIAFSPSGGEVFRDALKANLGGDPLDDDLIDHLLDGDRKNYTTGVNRVTFDQDLIYDSVAFKTYSDKICGGSNEEELKEVIINPIQTIHTLVGAIGIELSGTIKCNIIDRKRYWKFRGEYKIQKEAIDFNYFTGNGFFSEPLRDLATMGGKFFTLVGAINEFDVNFTGGKSVFKQAICE